MGSLPTVTLLGVLAAARGHARIAGRTIDHINGSEGRRRARGGTVYGLVDGVSGLVDGGGDRKRIGAHRDAGWSVSTSRRDAGVAGRPVDHRNTPRPAWIGVGNVNGVGCLVHRGHRRLYADGHGWWNLSASPGHACIAGRPVDHGDRVVSNIRHIDRMRRLIDGHAVRSVANHDGRRGPMASGVVVRIACVAVDDRDRVAAEIGHVHGVGTLVHRIVDRAGADRDRRRRLPAARDMAGVTGGSVDD